MLRNKKTSRTILEQYIENRDLLLDALPYPVSIVDTDFNIVKANKMFTDLYVRDGDFKGGKCYQVCHNAEQPVENCPLTMFLSNGEKTQIEIYEPALNRHFLLLSSPIIVENKLAGIIHSHIDITEQKEAVMHSNDLIDVFASSVTDMKARESKSHNLRDAFFNMLEDINESYKDLEDLFLHLVRVMVSTLDAKSPWTKGHSERVSIYAEQIGIEMSLDEDYIKELKLAGLLHDIGKIGTYDYLLDKPGRLTKEEFEIVMKHPAQGARILKGIKQLQNIIPYIHYHHEKLDGKGYPEKLIGDAIPLGAKILHVADSFDSMTSDRPYRPAPGLEHALSELNEFKGTQFEPAVVDAFLRVLEKVADAGADNLR